MCRNGFILICGGIPGQKQVETTLIYAYADTEAKRKAIEKAMGTGLAGTESVNYTVSDEDMLRRLYGL